MRDSDKVLDEHYASRPATPLPIFNSGTGVLPPLDINFNRIGIVLESANAYLTFAQPLSTADICGVICGWFSKRHVGVYRVTEWDSLPTKEFGRQFTVAMGETEGGWNVHSTYMMRLREYAAATVVKVGEKLEVERKKAVEKRVKLPERKKVMEYAMGEVQCRLMGRIKKMLEEEREKKETEDDVMEAFLVFEEERETGA
ncbi:hypothetical protein DE146DRAFT_118549 [Phaeosphaeria sp. MPI-PUGE-AT-0046c]|nr:hypothetical protein DE146DRAFT_118549 [Phaeosphaeria sp. MPI-PUGE-AT-0046c]